MQDMKNLRSGLQNLSEEKEEISDIDDDEEINQLILTEEERKLKTILWNNLNKDWIKEQQEKKRLKKEKKKLKNQEKKRTKSLKSKVIID